MPIENREISEQVVTATVSPNDIFTTIPAQAGIQGWRGGDSHPRIKRRAISREWIGLVQRFLRLFRPFLRMSAQVIVKRVRDFLNHLLVDVNNLHAVMAFILNHNAHLTAYLLHSDSRVVWSFQFCASFPSSVPNQADTDYNASINAVN